MRFRSEIDFIPHLPVLREQLCAPVKEDLQEWRRLSDRLAELPYTLSLSHYAVAELVHHANVAAGSIRDQPENERKANNIGIFGLGAEHEGPLAHSVDAFFDAARRTQNALIPYLGRRYSVSLPKSMSGVAKQIDKKKSPLGKDIQERIKEYWDRHGKRLKAYRDLGQHFSLLSSDARIVIPPDGRRALFFVLPNNPEVKNGAKLKFEDPTVFVTEYLFSELPALIDLVFDLTKAMLKLPLSVKRVAAITMRPPLNMRGPFGTYLIDEAQFDVGVDQFLSELHETKGVS